ncbi:MAG TPA: hypothetical protein VHH36_07575, partial [Candidatus Thermoplasmatota archaeon]|nr:hypothetical protein [Candidatus Thermoplasmatota archaeon]
CGGGQEECQVVGEAQGPSPLRLEIAAAEAGRISGVLRVESLHAAPAASPALLVSPSQAFRAEGFVLVGPAA